MDQTLSLTQLIAAWALPVLFAITLHEAAHGWVANKLGDKTALLLGRVTLNPLKHIDPIGTVIVPIVLLFLSKMSGTPFIFGWAKPVPVNWNNFKNPKRDKILVAFAGPLSNFLMALGWAFILKIGLMLQPQFGSLVALIFMGKAGILINLILMVLNLIPIPPLDGSRVVSTLLPPNLEEAYSRLEPYGFFILLALLWTGILSYILLPFLVFFQKVVLFLTGLL